MRSGMQTLSVYHVSMDGSTPMYKQEELNGISMYLKIERQAGSSGACL